AAGPLPASAVASHSASSVVLPKPAGAETRVSLPDPGSDDRSVWDAAPDPGVVWGRRAWFGAAGFQPPSAPASRPRAQYMGRRAPCFRSALWIRSPTTDPARGRAPQLR